MSWQRINIDDLGGQITPDAAAPLGHKRRSKQAQPPEVLSQPRPRGFFALDFGGYPVEGGRSPPKDVAILKIPLPQSPDEEPALFFELIHMEQASSREPLGQTEDKAYTLLCGLRAQGFVPIVFNKGAEFKTYLPQLDKRAALHGYGQRLGEYWYDNCIDMQDFSKRRLTPRNCFSLRQVTRHYSQYKPAPELFNEAIECLADSQTDCHAYMAQLEAEGIDIRKQLNLKHRWLKGGHDVLRTLARAADIWYKVQAAHPEYADIEFPFANGIRLLEKIVESPELVQAEDIEIAA